MPEVKPLIDVKEHKDFLQDERDVKAALVHVRPFATTDPISSWEEARAITDAVNAMKLVVDAAEERRKAINRPYEATTKRNNAHYKELLKQPNAALAKLSQKVVDFKKKKANEEAERQRKEQERLDREAEARTAEAQRAAELAAQEPKNHGARQAAADAHTAAAQAATATAAPANPPKQVRGSFGAIGTRTDYPFTVTDPSGLPADLLMPNDKAIKALISGERQMAKAQNRPFNLDLIPGVTITPVEKPVRR